MTGHEPPPRGGPTTDPDEAAYQRVLDFLVSRGVSEREVARARRDEVLHLLVADCLVLPTPGRYNALDMVERTGLERSALERLWRAMGFPEVDEDERAFSDVDLEAVQAAATFVGSGLADFDEIVQLTRVVGSSMARIADAEVAATPTLRPASGAGGLGPASGAGGLGPASGAGGLGPAGAGDSLASADFLVTSEGVTLTTIARLLEYVWRRHMQAALRRAALVRPGDLDAGHHEAGVQEMTVGFADLVGFTAQAQQLSEAALSQLVSRFEALAHDTVVSSGGRVVKMIGDEVMFVLDDPGQGVELGLALADAYADDELLSDVRVALAAGPVLAKDGDFYGPTVNLAHRIVNVARPGSVVASAAVHDALEGDGRFTWRTIRGRYLKDIGRVNLHVASRHAEGDEGITDRARRVGEQQVRSLLQDTVRVRFEDGVRRHG